MNTRSKDIPALYYVGFAIGTGILAVSRIGAKARRNLKTARKPAGSYGQPDEASQFDAEYFEHMEYYHANCGSIGDGQIGDGTDRSLTLPTFS